MSGTVTIGGHKIPKWGVWGGLAAAAGGVIWYWRKQSAAAAASTTASGTQSGIDPVTGLPYSQDNQTDPMTGMTYLAEAQQYGSVAAADASVQGNYTAAGGYGGGGYGGTSGYPSPGDGGGGTTSTGGPPYANNAQWAQAAEAGLQALGWNAKDVGAAIGRYLGQLPLDTQQVSIVQTAVAEYGTPPVGTYTIIPGGKNPGGGGGATNPVTGLHTTDTGYTSADIAWDAAQGATGYLITPNRHVTMTGATSARVGDLPRGATTAITVLATPAKTAAAPASVTVKTK